MLEKILQSPLDSKEIQAVHPKGNQSWIFIERTDAEAPILWPPYAKKLTHLKRSWCWERWKAGGEGDDRGWDGWMASPTWWTWVWASSGSWWWTRKPGVLQSVGSQSRTWLSDWTELDIYIYTYTHIFFIHSFVDGYLGCFHVHVHFQAIVNSAVMNIGVHVSFWTMVELNTLTPKFWLLTLMFIYNISVKKVNTKKNYRTKWWKLAEGNRQLLLLLILSQLSVGSSPS